MKSSPFPSILIALLLLSLQSFSVAAADDGYGLCNWLGGYYVTYDRCVDSLKADPRSRTADYHGLAVISVNLTIANATAVESRFGSIAKEASEPTTKLLLNRCFELFSSNVTSLRSAADAAASKNYAGAADLTLAFASMPGACDDGYRAEKGVGSPLMKENLDLMNLALVANAINDFLSKYY